MSTVLILDHPSLFRDAIARFLQNKGYATIVASDAIEAMHMLRSSRPDLTLLDVDTPMLDVPTFYELMLADPELRGIPVIILTTEAEQDRVRHLGNPEMRDCLLKSQFSLTELLARIVARLNA